MDREPANLAVPNASSGLEDIGNCGNGVCLLRALVGFMGRLIHAYKRFPMRVAKREHLLTYLSFNEDRKGI